MKLSIVTTLYYSAPYIEEFHKRATKAAQAIAGDDYEIILVNDGSPDNSVEVARKLIASDPHLKIVDLSRNFGHHRAMMAGLEHSVGDYVYLVDIDLEERPEWLLIFAEELAKGDADMVYGVQERRKGGLFERWAGAVYYKTFEWLADIRQPKNQVTARLMTARFKDAIIRYQEENMVFNCLMTLVGFEQKPMPVTKGHTSPTTYTFKKKLALALNSITSFSDKPLRILFYTGIIIFIFALLVGCWLLIKKYIFGIDIEGWTSIMLSIWLLGGFIITQIGICGLYIAKIFIETKGRPRYTVKDIIARDK